MNLFRKNKKSNDLLTIEELEKSRDRIKIASIRDKKNIRIVIAFPKTASATYLMCEYPKDVSQ